MKLVIAITCGCVLVGCHDDRVPSSFAVDTGGDAERGRERLVHHGCQGCHDIPGVRGPSAPVGPPLGGLARRTFLAGELPNTPANLVRWIRDPHAIERTTAMPSLGLTEEEARDVAAYLYTLD